MHIAVAFLGHGEVLGDVGGTLRVKVGGSTLGELLLSAATHQVTDEVVPIELGFLITQEVGLCGTVATDTEFGVLDVVRPVKLNVHVVFARLKILVLFPNVSVLSHLSILVGEGLLLSLWVLDLCHDQAHIRVIVLNVPVEAPIIRLVDRQIVMATRGRDHEANEGEGAKLMACLEEGVLVVIVDAAELEATEVLLQIRYAHEEGTIVFVGPIGLFLRRGGPAVGVITPITLPFEVTPRVPQLEKFDCVPERVSDLNTAQKTVRMVTNETKLFEGFDRRGS